MASLAGLKGHVARRYKEVQAVIEQIRQMKLHEQLFKDDKLDMYLWAMTYSEIAKLRVKLTITCQRVDEHINQVYEALQQINSEDAQGYYMEFEQYLKKLGTVGAPISPDPLSSVARPRTISASCKASRRPMERE